MRVRRLLRAFSIAAYLECVSLQTSTNVQLTVVDVSINVSTYMADTDVIVQEERAYMQTDEHA